MSKKDLVTKLDEANIKITPGALEILNNSNVPSSMLSKDLKVIWKGRTKPITVKDAIELMLNSDKYAQISVTVHEELKARQKEFNAVPRKFHYSYFTLKRFKEPVTAGQVAKITKRKTATEKVYLNSLVSEGLVKKKKSQNDKILYFIL